MKLVENTEETAKISLVMVLSGQLTDTRRRYTNMHSSEGRGKGGSSDAAAPAELRIKGDVKYLSVKKTPYLTHLWTDASLRCVTRQT